MKRSLSIVIPVYNEEKLISPLIERTINVEFPPTICSVELIVVNDCSSDNTPKVLNAIQSDWNSNHQLKIINQTLNGGKGKSVLEGVNSSKSDLIFVLDADLELIPEDIPRLIDALIELNIEFVNGSRYMPGVLRPIYSYKRYYFNKLFTRFASILINTRLTDLACGHKLFSRDLFNKLSLKEKRFGFEAELMIKTARLKRTLIAEVPVSYFPRNVGQGKKLKNIDGIRIFWVIIKYGLFRIN